MLKYLIALSPHDLELNKHWTTDKCDAIERRRINHEPRNFQLGFPAFLECIATKSLNATVALDGSIPNDMIDKRCSVRNAERNDGVLHRVRVVSQR